MVRNKKVLITGANGFVGANLVRYFLKNNQIHTLIKKDSNLWRIKDLKKDIHLHYSNLFDQSSLKTILKKINPHYIFHLAAHGSYSFQENIKQMIETNILGTYNLLEATRNLDYQCFINTGSSSEYGYKKKPMKEDDFLEPTSYYATTKSSATLLSQTFAKIYKKPVITFRLFSVYGPYEENSRFIPTAIIAAINNGTLNLTGAKTMHDFIFIDDVVNAYEAASQKDLNPGEIFNIGSGKQYSNLEIAKTIKNNINPKLKMRIGAYTPRSWDTSYWVCNNQKAKKILGWSPKYDIENGITKTADWLKLHPNYSINEF